MEAHTQKVIAPDIKSKGTPNRWSRIITPTIAQYAPLASPSIAIMRCAPTPELPEDMSREPVIFYRPLGRFAKHERRLIVGLFGFVREQVWQ